MGMLGHSWEDYAASHLGLTEGRVTTARHDTHSFMGTFGASTMRTFGASIGWV
jgi:hypothetical protein